VAKLKLSYFDFHGGRGEPARLALSMGGIPFEDDRVPLADWERRKQKTPFGALPVLEVDGQTIAQANAINCYVGKLTNLYQYGGTVKARGKARHPAELFSFWPAREWGRQ
jgi:glutathione S-transferase